MARKKIQKKPKKKTKIAAFFDLDRTLIRNTSAVTYGLFLIRRWKAPPKLVLNFIFGGMAYILFIYSARSWIHNQVAHLKGLYVKDYTKLADELFLPNPQRFFRPEIVRKYHWHKRRGDKVFIITQTYDLLAKYFADILKPDELISTELGIKDGKFTGHARLCTSDHKYLSVLRLAKEYNIDLKKSYAYTDSAHDISMLNKVGHVVVVNPKFRLSHEAHKKGWKIFKVHKHRKKVRD